MYLFALRFHTVIAEQRFLATIELDQLLLARQYSMYECFGVGVYLMVIDPYLINVIGEVIANSACGQIAFEIDQRRRCGGFTCDTDFIPEPAQILIIALQRLECLIFACSANDQPHIIGDFELFQDLFH